MVVTNYVLTGMILQVPCQCPNATVSPQECIFVEGISPSLSLNNPLNKAGDFLKGYLWGETGPFKFPWKLVLLRDRFGMKEVILVWLLGGLKSEFWEMFFSVVLRTFGRLSGLIFWLESNQETRRKQNWKLKAPKFERHPDYPPVNVSSLRGKCPPPCFSRKNASKNIGWIFHPRGDVSLIGVTCELSS